MHTSIHLGEALWLECRHLHDQVARLHGYIQVACSALLTVEAPALAPVPGDDHLVAYA